MESVKAIKQSKRQSAPPVQRGRCEVCFKPLTQSPYGRRKRYCSAACTMRAFKRRRAEATQEDVERERVHIGGAGTIRAPEEQPAAASTQPRSHHRQAAPVTDSQWTDIDPDTPQPPPRPHVLEGPAVWAAYHEALAEWEREHGPAPATPVYSVAPAATGTRVPRRQQATRPMRQGPQVQEPHRFQ